MVESEATRDEHPRLEQERLAPAEVAANEEESALEGWEALYHPHHLWQRVRRIRLCRPTQCEWVQGGGLRDGPFDRRV